MGLPAEIVAILAASILATGVVVTTRSGGWSKKGVACHVSWQSMTIT